MSDVTWSGKPYMKKTVVKFLVIFLSSTLVLSPLFYLLWTLSPQYGLIAFEGWFIVSWLYFAVHYYNKRAYVFYVTDKSVRIQKSWVFGTYEREITLDQIRDVYVSQGMLAKYFNCGSLMFVSTTGLEVGYAHGGAGVGAGVGVIVGGAAGSSTPQLLKGRGNTFWDITDPSSLRQTLIAKLTQWRQVVQEQRMAGALERITEKMPSEPKAISSTSLVGELERLSALLEKGAITKAEYEKAKEKLLKS